MNDPGSDLVDAALRKIAEGDEMYKGSAAHYFSVGRSALTCIQQSLAAARIAPDTVRCILDLPCGHGRVLRYLRDAFRDADITACDLLRAGVDFCATQFNARPCYSEIRPADIRLPVRDFDLIWVGSLFTHLDAHRWVEFLDFFAGVLRPGGALVFTTHGTPVYRAIASGTFTYSLPYWSQTRLRYGVERRGFGFTRYPSGSAEYGMSVTSPTWVIAKASGTRGLRVVEFTERAWDNHQDYYACVADESASVPGRTSTARYVKHRLRERLAAKE